MIWRGTPKSDMERQFNPFTDENGVLRVGEQLEYAEISYDNKHQMSLNLEDP